MPSQRYVKEVVAKRLPAEHQSITYGELRARLVRSRAKLPDRLLRAGLQALADEGRVVFRSDNRWPDSLRIVVCEVLEPRQFYAKREKIAIRGPELLKTLGFDAAKCIVAVDPLETLVISQWRHAPDFS